MSVKVVANEDEAIAHINRYGTMHSEAIVAEDMDACERFLDTETCPALGRCLGRVRQRQHTLH